MWRANTPTHTRIHIASYNERNRKECRFVWWDYFCSRIYIFIFFSILTNLFSQNCEWMNAERFPNSLSFTFCYRIFFMPIDKSVCVNHSILLLTKNFSPSNLLDFLLISLNTVAPLFLPSSWSFFLSFFSFGIFPFHCFVISPKHFRLNLLWFASFFAVLNQDSNNFCWKTVDKICLRVAISSLKRFTVVSYVVLLTQWMGWNKIKKLYPFHVQIHTSFAKCYCETEVFRFISAFSWWEILLYIVENISFRFTFSHPHSLPHVLIRHISTLEICSKLNEK